MELAAYLLRTVRGLGMLGIRLPESNDISAIIARLA
jgi:hypothetical protein